MSTNKKRKGDESSEEKLIEISSDEDPKPAKSEKKKSKSKKTSSDKEESTSSSEEFEEFPCFCPVDLCECNRCVTEQNRFENCRDCVCCTLEKLQRRMIKAKIKNNNSEKYKHLKAKLEKKVAKFKKEHKKYLDAKKNESESEEEEEEEEEEAEEEEQQESGPADVVACDKSSGQDQDLNEQEEESDHEDQDEEEDDADAEEEEEEEEESEDEVKPAAKKSRVVNGKGDAVAKKLLEAVKGLTTDQIMKLHVEADPTRKRPAFFKLDLHPHQVEGVKFLEEEAGGSACLIYEMGLGKTCMVLASICNYINRRRQAGDVEGATRPHLVVLPKSVKSSWTDDFVKFVDQKASGLTLKCIDEKKLTADEVKNLKEGVYNIVLIGYEKMRTEFMNLVKPFDILPKKFDFMKARSVRLVQKAIQDYPEKHKGKACPLQIAEDGTATGTIGTEHWLFGRKWSTLVLDEAHKIRNGGAQVFLASCAIQAARRYFVSGTPLHNKRDDVFNAFRFIRAQNLMPLDQWKKSYPDTQATHLADLSKKYLKWKKKEDIEGMQKVPMRIFQYKVPFSDKREQEVYREFETYMGRIAEQAQRCKSQHMSAASTGYVGAVHLFAAILAARQCCNAASIVSKLPDAIRDKLGDINGNKNGWAGTQSTKMKALRAVIKDHVSDGDKFLVFSSMLEALNVCDEILTKELGMKTVTLTGDMKDAERAEAIKKFRSDKDVRCFLISLKTGGEGLNLKEAKRVIILDPWWNYQAMLQAMCRAHRIDSEHEVRVTILSIAGTVEEVMLMKAEQKRKMADDLYQSATMYEMFSKANSSNGNGRQGEGRGLNELLDMVHEFRAANKNTDGSVDEEKEHEQREIRKEEIKKTVQTARAKKSVPEVSAKRKSPGQEPVSTQEAPEPEPLFHVGPVMINDLKQLERGTVLWDVRFNAPSRYPSSLERVDNYSDGAHHYYYGEDYRSTRRERANGEGLHASFLALFEVMAHVCEKSRDLIGRYGRVPEDYKELQNNKSFLGASTHEEQGLKALIADLDARVPKDEKLVKDVWELIVANQRSFMSRYFVETDPSGVKLPSANYGNTAAIFGNMLTNYCEGTRGRLEKAKADLKALEAARQLTPEQAKAARRGHKTEVRSRISDEVQLLVKIKQVNRNLDQRRSEFGLTYVPTLNISKVHVLNPATGLRDVSDFEELRLDPNDFTIFTAPITSNGHSLYRTCIQTNAFSSYHLTMKPEDLNPDKEDYVWDASETIHGNNTACVSLSTIPYAIVAGLVAEAVRMKRPHLVSLLLSALYVDPPAAKDKRSYGHRPHRYAVFQIGPPADSPYGKFTGAFAYLVEVPTLSGPDAGSAAQIVVFGAETTADGETEDQVRSLLTGSLLDTISRELARLENDRVIGDVLQRIVYRTKEKEVIEPILVCSTISTKRGARPFDRKELKSAVKSDASLKFKPFQDADVVILGGNWHERFIL